LVRIGVIGCGYWGPNLIRNFSKLENARLVAVADQVPAKLESVRRQYPSLQTCTDAQQVVAAAEVDAVAIATPISSHFALAQAAMENGKHVLVEKPLAATVSEAESLIALAEKHRRVLMVDHTFIYSGAVRRIRELIDAGEVGEIYYYDSVRVNLGLFQHDLNVLWDLGPHDFSIMCHLVNKKPVRLAAVGARPVRSPQWNLESLAYITVWFDDGTTAHFHLNWLSPVKIRRTMIGGSRRMVLYDHLDPDNQVKVFDKGVDVHTSEERYRLLVQYRSGDMVAPKVDQTEALEAVCAHFVECVASGRAPLTDGQAGRDVVRLLEAAQKSIAQGGSTVDL
jgi:predicted dehydrogenase